MPKKHQPEYICIRIWTLKLYLSQVTTDILNYKPALLGIYFPVLPSRAGPVLKKHILGWFYCAYIFPYRPVEDLGMAAIKNSLGNTLGIAGYITIVVFYSISLLDD